MWTSPGVGDGGQDMRQEPATVHDLNSKYRCVNPSSDAVGGKEICCNPRSCYHRCLKCILWELYEGKEPSSESALLPT